MALRRSVIKEAGCPAVVRLRLWPTPGQTARLDAAVVVCNTAATYASRIAWRQQVFGQFPLQRLLYRDLRREFPGLGAQAAVRVFARVAGTYTNRGTSRKRAHVFRPRAAVPFDARMLSFNRDARTVSIGTPTGRVHVPYTGREQDLKAIETLPIGESGLIERNGA
jgi:putative transposase